MYSFFGSILLLLLSFISLFRPIFLCPLTSSPQCICQPGPSIICSCSPFRPKLRLSGRFLPPKVHQFIVHSCPQLFIPAGTFRSKIILDQIKFLDIGSLHFESNSFHGIRRSPRLLLLQNISHIPSIPPMAFAGLARLQHFWLRNLSIGVIRPRAFSKLRKSEYLYFHQVHIQRVESGGFGQISGLEHFFIRDRIRLDWLAEGAFKGSKMEELVVENALVKGHAGAIEGIRAKRIRLLNCRWGGRRRRRNKSKGKSGKRKEGKGENRIEGGAIEEMLIRNSTLWEMFSPLKIQTQMLIENSSLGLMSNGKNFNGQNHLRIRGTRIRLWESPALGWAQAMLEHSRIGTIRPSASHFPQIPLPLPRLRFVECHLRFVAPNSFAISSFELLNSTISRWQGSPLAMAGAGSEILIDNSRMGIKAGDLKEEGENGRGGGAFAELNAAKFRLQQSKIEGPMGENPFWRTNISQRMEMRNCQFTDSLPESLFNGLTAAKGVEFSGNEWPCGQNECGGGGIEQLLLASISLPHWHFADNRCFSSPPPENATLPPQQCPHHSPSQNDPPSSSLLCRQFGHFFQECLCISSPPPQPIPLHPSPQIRVLLLSDCADSVVQLRWENSTILSHFYAFRVGQIQMDQIPPSLRHLQILHSALHFESPQAFSNAKLMEMNILDGQLEGEAPLGNAFDWSRLGQIGLEKTQIGQEWAKALAIKEGGGEMPLEGNGASSREPQLRKRCAQEEDCPERNGQREDGKCFQTLLLLLIISLILCQ